MKEYIYRSAFVVFGVVLQFVIHAVIEIWYIGLLLQNFETYGFGLSWQTWFIIHYVGTAILFIAGIIFGYWQGQYWWTRLYFDDGRRRK